MWFFGKKKKLQAELEQKNKELEELRAKLSEKEGLLDEKANNSLESVNKELSGSKKRIADFEAKQESISSALTEATEQKERIIKAARLEAKRLEDEGKKRRDEFISEGNRIEEKAKAAAEKTLEDAREKAKKDVEKTYRDAENAVSEAERLSKEMLEKAEKSAHGMIDEAEAHVKEREGRLDELNARLKERARRALEDAEFYADTLDTVGVSDAKKTAVKRKTTGETPGAAKVAKDMREARRNAAQDGTESADGYKSAAALMRSIYAIQGRELPGDGDADGGDETGEESFSMPVDPDLSALLGEILDNK